MMKNNWKVWAGLFGATMAGLGVAWAGIKQGEEGITRRQFQIKAGTDDEKPVPVLHLGPAKAKRDTPAVLVAHGFSGSKELMQFLGNGVAKLGLHAFMMDLPGHGDSAAPLPAPVMDFSNVVNLNVRQLERVYHHIRETLPHAKIGVLGHSMGSGAIMNFAERHPGLETAIPISLAGRQPATPHNPRNMLLLVGQRDIPICLSSSQEILDKALPGGKGKEGEFHGNFKHGTARQMKILPKLDHITILFAPTTIKEVNNWLVRVFDLKHQPEHGTQERLYWTGGGLAAAFTGFLPLARLLTKPVEGAPTHQPLKFRESLLPLAVMTGSPFLSALFWHKVKPPKLTRLFLADYLLGLFGLSGAINLGVAGAKKHFAADLSAGAKAGLGSKAWNWGVLPVLLWGYLYGTVGLFSRRTWKTFDLTPQRARAMAAIHAALLPYFLASDSIARRLGGWKGYFAAMVSRFGLMAALIMAVYLNNELAFLMILQGPFLLSFLLLELYSLWLFRLNRDFVTGSATQSLTLAWIISTTFPTGEI